jgi:type II secretory pathway component PulF
MATPAFQRITISTSEKIALVGNLATMLSAGIPIIEAVDSLLEGTKGNLKIILETLKADLMQGKRVYLSLSVFPRVFDTVTVSLIHASEEAGTLETTLKELREHIQKDAEFMDKVKLAMLYPGFIFLVFIFVLMVILLFVMPKISLVFSRLRVDLPLPTRAMIYVSNLLTQHPLYVGLAFAAFVLVCVIIFRTQRQRILNILFSLPLISSLVKQIDLTRFTRSFYLLYVSGLPITTALQLTQDVVIRRQTSELITRCREMVISGKKLVEGFKTSKNEIPPIMLKLVEAGEKSGTLDKSMLDISNYLDYEVSNTLKTLTSILEPVMLVVVALSVGGMMMAIIAPIYGMISQVGNVGR